MNKKILIVTDVWDQINGVVTTLKATKRELEEMGHEVVIVSPDNSSWRTLGTPLYPEIKTELLAGQRMGRIIDKTKPTRQLHAQASPRRGGRD